MFASKGMAELRMIHQRHRQRLSHQCSLHLMCAEGSFMLGGLRRFGGCPRVVFDELP
jgi:hypothetical protein